MGHAVRVQVIQCRGNLVRQLLGTSLSNRECTFFEVAKQITACQLFHDDVNIVLILKDIQQSNNMRVLAHLEDFDLTSLQFDVLHRHLLLRHDFHGNRLARLLVDGRFNKAEFSLAQSLFDLIEIENV